MYFSCSSCLEILHRLSVSFSNGLCKVVWSIPRMTVPREIICASTATWRCQQCQFCGASISFCFLFGDKKAVFLYSLVLFNAACSATELLPGSVASLASHQPSPQWLLRIYPHSFTSAQIAFWLPVCLCLWVASIKKPGFMLNCLFI